MIKKSIFGIIALFLLLSQLTIADLETPAPIPFPDEPEPIPIPLPEPIPFDARTYSGHKNGFDFSITVYQVLLTDESAFFTYDVGICGTEPVCRAFAFLNAEGKVLKKRQGALWVIETGPVKAKLYPDAGSLKIDGYPSVHVELLVK